MGRVKLALVALMCIALAAAEDSNPNEEVEIIGSDSPVDRGFGDPVAEGTNLQGQVYYDYSNYGNSFVISVLSFRLNNAEIPCL
jgi:hypothetical protein